MGPPAAGQVVLLPFPFSDLTRSKLRPALLLAAGGRGDWISCQITSNRYADSRAIQLTDKEFVHGGLKRISYARPSELFTAHESLFASAVGRLAYVRLKRAKKRVHVSFAANRRVHGNWQSALPSRFISELPEQHVDR